MRGDLAPEKAAEALPDAASAGLLADEPNDPSPPRGWWARLRDGLTRTGGADRRLAALQAAIRSNPNAPANYLLRAELYTQLGESALALADFERAQALAASALAADRWGVVNQALRDRAAIGAAQAARRLAAPPRRPQPEDDDE
ncbi:MAG: hypothetical protein ACUVSX_13190 [Aggregatilineales bacterium]